MIYVTHDQTEALTFADEVVVMQDGEVVQIGTPVDLFERPAPHLRRPLHRLARHERAALRAARRRAPSSPAARRHRQPRRRPPGAPRSACARIRLARRRGIPAEIVRVADIGRHRVVEARAADQPGQRAPARGHPVALGPTHLAFQPAQTRIYIDGWLAEGRA